MVSLMKHFFFLALASLIRKMFGKTTSFSCWKRYYDYNTVFSFLPLLSPPYLLYHASSSPTSSTPAPQMLQVLDRRAVVPSSTTTTRKNKARGIHDNLMHRQGASGSLFFQLNRSLTPHVRARFSRLHWWSRMEQKPFRWQDGGATPRVDGETPQNGP
jgi:hypothetical protein